MEFFHFKELRRKLRVCVRSDAKMWIVVGLSMFTDDNSGRAATNDRDVRAVE